MKKLNNKPVFLGRPASSDRNSRKPENRHKSVFGPGTRPRQIFPVSSQNLPVWESTPWRSCPSLPVNSLGYLSVIKTILTLTLNLNLIIRNTIGFTTTTTTWFQNKISFCDDDKSFYSFRIILPVLIWLHVQYGKSNINWIDFSVWLTFIQ